MIGSRHAGWLRMLERVLLVIALLCFGYVAAEHMAAARDQASLARELERSSDVPRLATPHGHTTRARPESGALVGRLEVPRLGVSAIAREGADAKTLRRAVGHVSETALPGEKGKPRSPAIAIRSSASCSTCAPAIRSS